MKSFSQIQDQALGAFSQKHPRASYGQAVLECRQRVSGSDLRGRANKYSGSYARTRKKALSVWYASGGTVIAAEHGRLLLAARVGTDDYGNAVYHTYRGVAVQHTAKQVRHI